MEASSELKIGYFVSSKQIFKVKEIKLKQLLHTFFDGIVKSLHVVIPDLIRNP
jgi:hypothetical protein